MNENNNRLLQVLKSLEKPLDCADKVAWDNWKEELAAVVNRMPVFKTMRYQAIQSVAKEKIEEIQCLKPNKTILP